MIIIITGKAGSGKTTIKNLLLKKLNNFSKCVSYTTRAPRLGEQEGVDYCFISKNDFLGKKDIFLKREENGNFYGVDKNSFQSKNVVTILDLNGISEIIKFFPKEDIRLIYLHVPHRILIERLTKRGNSSDVILRRLGKDTNITEATIKQEIFNKPLLVLNNTRSLTTSLDEIICFVNKPHVFLHQRSHIISNFQNQRE